MSNYSSTANPVPTRDKQSAFEVANENLLILESALLSNFDDLISRLMGEPSQARSTSNSENSISAVVPFLNSLPNRLQALNSELSGRIEVIRKVLS